MSNPILVTYATGTGSTIGVAKAIGETLMQTGIPVEVRPVRLKFRLSVGIGVWSECDHRYWKAIRTWANSLKQYVGRSPDHAV